MEAFSSFNTSKFIWHSIEFVFISTSPATTKWCHYIMLALSSVRTQLFICSTAVHSIIQTNCSTKLGWVFILVSGSQLIYHLNSFSKHFVQQYGDYGLTQWCYFIFFSLVVYAFNAFVWETQRSQMTRDLKSHFSTFME